MKIRLRDIQVNDLDSQSVILLSNFVRTARTMEGANISMLDDDIVHVVFNLGAKTDNPILRVVFKSIRRRLQKQIKEHRLNPTQYH